MSNTIKAVIYTIVGVVGIIINFVFAIRLWFSGTFLPVYVGGNFILGNRIFRLFLYFVIFAVLIQLFRLTAYGYKFLNKKIHRKLKRR